MIALSRDCILLDGWMNPLVEKPPPKAGLGKQMPLR